MSAAVGVGAMLYGNTQVNVIAEAVQQGEVSVSVVGVNVQGSLGYGAGVEASNAQMGDVGLGAVQGQEVSSISLGYYESGKAAVGFGKKTQIKTDAFEGIQISAGTQGSLSYGGVSVGGGATVYGPGSVGGESEVSADFTGDNIQLSVTGGLDLGIGGLALSLNLTLPTAPIISALQTIGLDYAQGAAATAEAIASEATALANSVSSAATALENAAETAASDVEDAFDWVSSLF
jgi:hypothetical protein